MICVTIKQSYRLVVTQITLNTEPHGFDSCQGRWQLDTSSLAAALRRAGSSHEYRRLSRGGAFAHRLTALSEVISVAAIAATAVVRVLCMMHLPETRPCFSKTIHEILAEFQW